jgi:uncharacterized membrane protein
MTILVLDLKLPDRFHPADAGALAKVLVGLWPKFLPYASSFYVLGVIWLANIKLRSHGDFVDRRYVFWWLIYLLLATCLPFSTSVVGEFAQYRPAVWLYSFNLAALSIIGYRLLALLPGLEHDEHALDRKVSLVLLMATSALCVGFSLINPANALWVYVMNPAAPHLARWIRVKRGSHGKSYNELGRQTDEDA